MNFETAIFFVVSSGALFFAIAIFFRKPASGFVAYYLDDREVSPSAFIDSTTVYALQVAAITLFASWGYYHGLWALMVPIFWGCGYFLVAYIVHKGHADSFLLENFSGTIHQFLANSGKYKMVAALAAVCTTIGLAGPAMFEAKFVADLVEHAILHNQPSTGSVGLLLMFSFVAIVAIYMVYGGFSEVVKTDQLQLAIGFGLFMLVFAGLFLTTMPVDPSMISPLAAVCLFLIAVIVLTKIGVDRFLGKTTPGKLKLYDYLSYASLLASFAAFLAVFVKAQFIETEHGFLSNMMAFIDRGFSVQFRWWGIAGLAVANGFYQMVDVGHWQRLLSLKVDLKDEKQTRRTVVVSTIAAGIYSPATWALAVLFGVGLRILLPEGDPWIIVLEFSDWLRTQELMGTILAVAFFTSLMMIMFSTLDSMTISTAYTIHNDIVPIFFGKFNYKTLFVARLVTLSVLLIYPAYYLFMETKTGTRFDAVLYFSWSCQIALFPAVMAALLKKANVPFTLLLSIMAGGVGAAWPLFIAERPELVYSHSPVLALLASSATFLVLYKLETHITNWRNRGTSN